MYSNKYSYPAVTIGSPNLAHSELVGLMRDMHAIEEAGFMEDLHRELRTTQKRPCFNDPQTIEYDITASVELERLAASLPSVICNNTAAREAAAAEVLGINKIRMATIEVVRRHGRFARNELSKLRGRARA